MKKVFVFFTTIFFSLFVVSCGYVENTNMKSETFSVREYTENIDKLSISNEEEARRLLASSEKTESLPMLEDWYFTDQGERLFCAIGNVHNRAGFEDGSPVVTSSIEYVYTDFDKQVVLVQTKNTLYRCYFDKCDINNPDFITDYLSEYNDLKALLGK